MQTHDKFFAREIIEDFATEYSIGAPKNSSPAMEDIKIIEPPGFISDLKHESGYIELKKF